MSEPAEPAPAEPDLPPESAPRLRQLLCETPPAKRLPAQTRTSQTSEKTLLLCRYELANDIFRGSLDFGSVRERGAPQKELIVGIHRDPSMKLAPKVVDGEKLAGRGARPDALVGQRRLHGQAGMRTSVSTSAWCKAAMERF